MNQRTVCILDPMSQEYVVRFGDRELHVSLVAEQDIGWTVVVDGRAYPTEIRRLTASTWSLLVAGRSHLVHAKRQGEVSRVAIGAESHRLTVLNARRARFEAVAGKLSSESSRKESLAAPIAGKVVALPVSVGEAVVPGQSLVVVEAMKMENELRSTHGGVVKAIHVAIGEVVETGQELVSVVSARSDDRS